MNHENPWIKHNVSDRELDDAVELYGSYHEAYRHLGITPDEVEFEDVLNFESSEATLPPLAVSLASRALALEQIMEYLNKENQLRGFVMKQSGDGMRRGRPLDMTVTKRRIEASRDRLKPQFQAGLDTLVAAEAMQAHGYDKADIELARLSLKKQLNDAFGPGRAYANDRHEAVKKAKNVA